MPLTICLGSYDACKNLLLEKKSSEFLHGTATDESHNAKWIKVNVNQTGFYRVKYDEALSAKLRHAIENKFMTETDRFGSFFNPILVLFAY